MRESQRWKRAFVRASRTIRWLTLSAVSLVLLQGCETGFTTIAPEVPTTAAKIGPAQGSASSYMFIAAGTAYYFIPVAWDGRAKAAYDEALASAPGATAVGRVTLEEDWYWWLLGASRVLTVSGEGVKP